MVAVALAVALAVVVAVAVAMALALAVAVALALALALVLALALALVLRACAGASHGQERPTKSPHQCDTSRRGDRAEEGGILCKILCKICLTMKTQTFAFIPGQRRKACAAVQWSI